MNNTFISIGISEFTDLCVFLLNNKIKFDVDSVNLNGSNYSVFFISLIDFKFSNIQKYAITQMFNSIKILNQ